MSGDACPRCGHLILEPQRGCQVCPVLDAERQLAGVGSAVAGASTLTLPPATGPITETYFQLEWVNEEPCSRCGSSLLGDRERPCEACQLFDQEAIDKGWTSEQTTSELADWRRENLRRLQEERAKLAGKSDQQIEAERKAAQTARTMIEPEIYTPPFLLDPDRPLESYDDQEQQEAAEWAERRRLALPVGVPEFNPSYGIPSMACSYVSGGEAEAGYGLVPLHRFFMVSDGPTPAATVIDTIPFLEISGLTVTGPEQAERVVTRPRALALGLFSLAAKKEIKHSYLSIERHQQQALLFRFDGMSAIELQQVYSPLLTWHQQHRDKLIELYRLWHPS